MPDREMLGDRFEQHRARLSSMAYNMLGSLADAEDAVQEAWLRLERSDSSEIENLAGWLTTVVGRVCLDDLRSRAAHPEQSLDAHLPDPVVEPWRDEIDPEDAALTADVVGLALLVVLDTLSPGERIAFVLHDVFGVPFEQVGSIVERSEPAARKLASRARGKIQRSNTTPDGDRAMQRRAVEAFVTAARGGDFTTLLEVLDPDVVVRADHGEAAPLEVLGGSDAVGERAVSFARAASGAQLAMVNGTPGAVVGSAAEPQTVLAFTVRDGRIVEIDIITDWERLRRLSA